MEDLEQLTTKNGAWTLTLLAASGALEPSYPTIFHFSTGGGKGDESFEGDNLIVKDMATCRTLYEDLSACLENEFNMKSDHQRYHAGSSPNLFVRKYEEGKGAENNVILRVAWSASLWDTRRIKIAKVIADKLNEHICGAVPTEYDPDLKVSKSGY
jgi:voltage-gated potassium channel